MNELYCYEYPRPSVTVDVVVFTLREDSLHVLLVRRKHEPFKDRWSIPGGFLELHEPIETAALRELREETGIKVACPLAPIGFFGDVDRDPRGRTISLAFATAIPAPAPEPCANDDAADAGWFSLASVDGLAFDHDRILTSAREWLRLKVNDGPVGLSMLPESFTRTDIQTLFRAVYGPGSTGASWFRRLTKLGAILPLDRRGQFQSSFYKVK